MKVVKTASMITRGCSVEIRVFKKFWLAFGFNQRQLALGFTINRYQVHLDLLLVWIAIEV
jgi:hypothetical protein